MFIEPLKADRNRGWIEVICGSMFSGKTEELIRRLKRAQIAKMNIEIFKPALDTRYAEEAIVSHDQQSFRSTSVTASQNILLLSGEAEVVAVDEAQFFDDELPYVAESLANKGVRVIIAGLDMDFKGQPFGPVPALLAKADYITKLHAVCVLCGHHAHYSYRKTADASRLLLGELDKYEPRCRHCFYNEK